jgi:uncharacterized protein YcbK (DUF882 family)
MNSFGVDSRIATKVISLTCLIEAMLLTRIKSNTQANHLKEIKTDVRNNQFTRIKRTHSKHLKRLKQMSETINIEQAVLGNLRILPNEKQQEVLDFAEFLVQKVAQLKQDSEAQILVFHQQPKRKNSYL